MATNANLDYRDPEWVAQQLGIDKNAVYRYLDEGTLPGLRLGRKWLISESSLAEYLKREEREQTKRRRAGLRKYDATPYDRFVRRARRLLTQKAGLALALAWEEALELGDDHLGTEHLLLGLLREGDGVAAAVLRNLGVVPDELRAAAEALIDRGEAPYGCGIDLTPRARRTLELAVKEARRLKHHYVGTEHLLLGIVRAGEGIGFELLEQRGVTPERVRAEVERVLSQPREEAGGSAEDGEESVSD